MKKLLNKSFCNNQISKETQKEIKINEIYSFKKRLQKPDISKWIDKSKFTNENYKLETKIGKIMKDFSETKVNEGSNSIINNTNTSISLQQQNDSNNKTLSLVNNKENELNEAQIDNSASTNESNTNIEKKNNPIPISPRLGPFEIKNPKTEDKTYHWCSCGMSKKQPFCDRSHKGTGFKPVNFKIGEKVESIFLCGCKLSSKIPFCDGVTCKELNENYEKELNKKLEQINIKI